MIVEGTCLPPLPPWHEMWHCGHCSVMFDRASADLSGDVIACPRCGRVNLGYVGGPGLPATEEVDVIDEPKPARVPAADNAETLSGLVAEHHAELVRELGQLEAEDRRLSDERSKLGKRLARLRVQIAGAKAYMVPNDSSSRALENAEAAAKRADLVDQE